MLRLLLFRFQWVKSWRTTQTIFPWSKTSPHKLPWNWPAMDNCAPYYSKPCCGLCKWEQIASRWEIKAYRVDDSPPECHWRKDWSIFSWLWLRLVPWAITRPVQERAKVLSPQQLTLTETSGSICVLINACADEVIYGEVEGLQHEGFVVYPYSRSCSIHKTVL